MHESSDKALKIMIATTIMGLVILVWAGITLSVKGSRQSRPVVAADLSKKFELNDAKQLVPKINPITRTHRKIRSVFWAGSPRSPSRCGIRRIG